MSKLESNSKQNSLYQMYLKISETLNTPSVNIGWLSEKLNNEDFLKLETEINYYLIENHKIMFFQGFFDSIKSNYHSILDYIEMRYQSMSFINENTSTILPITIKQTNTMTDCTNSKSKYFSLDWLENKLNYSDIIILKKKVEEKKNQNHEKLYFCGFNCIKEYIENDIPMNNGFPI